MTYLLWLILSAVLCTALYFLTLRRAKVTQPAALAALTLLCGGVLGLILSKLVYYLAKIDFMMAMGWARSLIDTDPTSFSYYGGMAGVCLGAALAAKLTGAVKPMKALNLFAPAGALLAALARFGEAFYPTDLMYGFGKYLENEGLWFFPLAVGNEWDEYYLAVFMLEGILSLIVAAVSLCCFKKDRFLRTLFYLCLFQIFCESLRSDSFSWLFVKVEQLICAVTVTAVLALYAVFPEKKARCRFLPLITAGICVLLFVGIEFALDKTDIPHVISYAAMWLGLAAMAAAECIGYRRWTKKEQ